MAQQRPQGNGGGALGVGQGVGIHPRSSTPARLSDCQAAIALAGVMT